VKFRSLLVANRGEIALRVMRTARRMGLRTIAVYSDADRDAPHVRAADAAVHIGGSAPKDSYLNIEAILAAAKHSAAEAIHPGYGFLSENEKFSIAIEKKQIIWVGPPPAAIRAMGDKANAKAIAAKAGVPVLPTYDKNPEFPLMIKAVAGGGGRGIRLVRSKADLESEMKTARSEAMHAFGDDRVILEKALERARHVEVQVFADQHGNCVHLGERDCSVQRRHQKLIEESPSPAVNAKLRNEMGAAAVALTRAAGYAGAGTVEFLLGEDGRFWFMEMNTRLQVEHPVTEAITGLDLVEWQLRVAAGEPLPLRQEDVSLAGHAIEARLCAEDPPRQHLPQAGRLALWRAPADARTDHALESGIEISSHYDSLIAKIVCQGTTRDEAREKLAKALDSTLALGIRTNRHYLWCILQDREFATGGATTSFLSGFHAPGISITLRQTFAALAAAIGAQASARDACYGELSSWSNNAAHHGSVRLRERNLFHDVTLRFDGGSYFTTVDGQDCPLRVRLEENQALVGLADGGTEVLRWCRSDGFLHLAGAHRDWSFEDVTHEPPRRQTGGAYDGVRAPMNGRVVALHAKAGDLVDEGKVLVVMEAMKMEHQLAAPGKLRVKAVHAALGAQVAPGQLLVEFEPPAA
jgi:geranyl-CoA carboxylase alpha subunit